MCVAVGVCVAVCVAVCCCVKSQIVSRHEVEISMLQCVAACCNVLQSVKSRIASRCWAKILRNQLSNIFTTNNGNTTNFSEFLKFRLGLRNTQKSVS